MKNRINLFKRKPQQDYFSANAPKLKKYLTILGAILFIIFLILIIQIIFLNTEQQEGLTKKETYLRYLLSEKDIEANIRYFKSKQLQVNTFLKEDAQFVPYYEVLKKSLGETANDKATLEAIDIDKDRNTRFVVKFNNTDEMLLFLRYIETEEFLTNFQSLTLQSFSLNQQQKKGSNYQLELQGVFKELKIK